MNEEKTEEKLVVWVNTEERIVTFRELEGYEVYSFQDRKEQLAYVCKLCESGYRIL